MTMFMKLFHEVKINNHNFICDKKITSALWTK